MAAADMDMSDFLEAVAEQATAAPAEDAPADFLHQRGLILGLALRAVAAGEYPADALEVMEERLAAAARPAVQAVAPPEWRRHQLTAAS